MRKIIDYLYDISKAGVVGYSYTEDFANIRSSFNELSQRRNTQNNTYQTIHDIARSKIYTLQFPSFFNTHLPQTDIYQVLEELR